MKYLQLIMLAVFILISGAAYANEALYEQHIARGIADMGGKNYKEAKESFMAALKEKPDDYRAALYLGIALSRTKDKDAEAMLKKAYSISPNEPRINLELGVYYFDNNKYDEAKGYLNNAMKLSQDDELKDRAEEYLAVIGEKGIKKKWLLNISIGGQYDTNVILTADTTPLPEGISGKADWRGVIELNGRYRFITGQSGGASIGYSLYQSIHAKLNDFDISYHLLDLSASYAIKPYLSLNGSYSFEYVFVGSDSYDYAHSVYPSIIIAEGKGLSTTIGYRYKNKRFIDSETYQTNSDKDGSNHLAGITQNISYSIIHSRLGYAYDKDITKKDYWDYNGHKGFIDIMLKLPYRFSLDLYGEYSYREYSGINPLSNIKRKDGVYTYSASISKAITDWFGVTISQTYIDNGSNIIYYNYNRAITSLFLTGRF
ncbi:MAG: tetratricopeptide repeat protein [Nitrospirota bacterium]